MNTSVTDQHIKAASTYFAELDSGRIPEEFFAPDFEFYFPKFDVGQGLEELQEFAVGLVSAGLKVTHHRDRLKYLACGSKVIVEGTTYGTDGARGSWDGGATSGGRFCSVLSSTIRGWSSACMSTWTPTTPARTQIAPAETALSPTANRRAKRGPDERVALGSVEPRSQH